MKKLLFIMSILFCQNIFADEIILKWTIEEFREDGEPFSLDEIEKVEVYHASKKGANLGDYNLDGEVYGKIFAFTKTYPSGVNCFVLVLYDNMNQKSVMSKEKCYETKSRLLPPTGIEITYTTTVRIQIGP